MEGRVLGFRIALGGLLGKFGEYLSMTCEKLIWVIITQNFRATNGICMCICYMCVYN